MRQITSDELCYKSSCSVRVQQRDKLLVMKFVINHLVLLGSNSETNY